MRKIFIVICLIYFFASTVCCAKVMEGGVEKTGINGNQVIDKNTNQPVSEATVTLPMLQYKTVTDENGVFHLGTKIDGKTVMSVEKEGYRPYSVTIDKNTTSNPIIVGIQKSNANDIQLENNLMHLGDNNYSRGSANSGDFKIQAIGPFYSKWFNIPNASKNYFLVIGSIIGVDTAIARSMGQNRIRNSYSSPPEIFLNGQKIAEIHLNGDGQRIKLPTNLIKFNQNNELAIKTGKNLTQKAYTDYDDIEIMNLSIISE